MLASNRVECSPERFQMQAATHTHCLCLLVAGFRLHQSNSSQSPCITQQLSAMPTQLIASVKWQRGVVTPYCIVRFYSQAPKSNYHAALLRVHCATCLQCLLLRSTFQPML